MHIDELRIAIWLIICTVLASLLVMLLSNSKAGAELCLAKVDSGIAKKLGYRWQWRQVDGRKCWFYANTLLPKEDLIWSYTSEEFDADIDRIIERKFYLPEKP